ncbi:hypothetical protein EST38_g11907 [Candolleomyces aberdarensis]|uniref:Uncharacterized protein n=1 Tax=Candolleomyces aberdarensis TaxID=2316362 RepID=A0A4Q2D5A2_9AGAR|nr:hypothetical protein EST38_g11907 [Candolleomyces aberdarensis]
MEVPRAEDDPQFLLTIRDAIIKSRQPGGTPFDAVQIHCCSGITPDPALWEALADARPSHLEMNTGWDETCNYDGLSQVQPPWDLKSMYLAAYEGDGSWEWGLEPPTAQQHSFPACYACLETLVLDYPSGHYLYFYPEGGATNLRSLTVLENDSVTVFARTVDCNPKLVETLRSVALGCFIPDEGRSVRRMKRFFKEAKGLINLELAMGDVKLFPENSAELELGDESLHQQQEEEEEEQSETGPSTVVEVVLLSESNDGEVGPSVPHHISPVPFGPGEGENNEDGISGEYEDEDDDDDEDYEDEDDDDEDYEDGDGDGDDDDDDDDDDNYDDDDDAYDDEEVPTYIGLPDVLPNTLQHFSLRGPANSIMLKELDEWIVRARDPSWLTNLQTIAFRLINPVQGKTASIVHLTEKEKEELKRKIDDLLNIFRQRSPPVEVVEPRLLAQLRYPLAF